MSWTDEELDNLAREAAASSQVEYKEAYWHEMEALLGENTTSKGGVWWWLTGIVLLIGVSTVFVGSRIDGLDSNQQTASNNELNNVSLSNVQGQNATTNQLSNSIDGEYSQVETQSIDGRTANSNNKSNAQSTSLKSNKNVVVATNETWPLTTSGLNGSKAYGEAIDVKAMSNSEVNHVEPLMLKSPSANKENKNSQELNHQTNEGLCAADVMNNEELELAELTMVDWENELNPSPILRHEQLPLLAGKRIGFYVGLNGGLGQSYVMTAKNNEIYQAGLNGGLEFYRKNWAFGTGLGIRQQFTQNLTVVNSRRYYSFGAVNVNQNMTYDRMLFADVNLTASYRFGRSEFGVLATPTYLLGARLSAMQSTEEIMGATKTMNYESKATKQYVSSDNFNAFGLNLGLNYAYTLTRNVAIQAGVNVRVIQPMLNTRFEGVERKIPLMVELGLKKRF